VAASSNDGKARLLMPLEFEAPGFFEAPLDVEAPAPDAVAAPSSCHTCAECLSYQCMRVSGVCVRARERHMTVVFIPSCECDAVLEVDGLLLLLWLLSVLYNAIANSPINRSCLLSTLDCYRSTYE